MKNATPTALLVVQRLKKCNPYSTFGGPKVRKCTPYSTFGGPKVKKCNPYSTFGGRTPKSAVGVRFSTPGPPLSKVPGGTFDRALRPLALAHSLYPYSKGPSSKVLLPSRFSLETNRKGTSDDAPPPTLHTPNLDLDTYLWGNP